MTTSGSQQGLDLIARVLIAPGDSVLVEVPTYSGAVAGLCPTTEANLGDGLFPLGDYLAAGGRWGIGSDSHVSQTPVEELRWLDAHTDGKPYGIDLLMASKYDRGIQQQKLDALHAAGRELAGLDASQLTDMNVADRVELLKVNLRRTIHDLLHYDTIEVRLLDRRTLERHAK